MSEAGPDCAAPVRDDAASPPARAFRGFLEAGEFRIQRCAACGAHAFPPTAACRRCDGEDLAWVRVAGPGTVYSTTVVRRRPDRGGDYNVCLVDLDEGVRMMSRVEGLPPAEVAIGMRVTSLVAREDGEALVLFRPSEARDVA